jgi:hypothetical protein
MGGRLTLVNCSRSLCAAAARSFSTGGGGFGLASGPATDKSDLVSQLCYWHITVEAIEVTCPTPPKVLVKISMPPAG